MDKRIVLTGILLQLCASLAWGQGFGDRRLITDNWYFELGDGKYWGAEYFDHSKWRKLKTYRARLEHRARSEPRPIKLYGILARWNSMVSERPGYTS